MSELRNVSPSQLVNIESNTRACPADMLFDLNADVSEANRESTMIIDEVLVASFYEKDEEIDDFLFEIVLSLYGSKSLTFKHCDEIIKYLRTISEKTTQLCAKRISGCTTISEAQDALKQRPIIDFEEYSSEYKIKEKVKKMNLFREPTTITIANEVVEKFPGDLQNVEHSGVIMDIEFQITKFLEIDGILDLILTYQEHLQNLPDGIYKNLLNGKYWKRISSTYKEKTLIPLFLYNDDFQVRLQS